MGGKENMMAASNRSDHSMCINRLEHLFSGCHRFDHTMCINWSDSLVAFKREYAEYISLWSQMCINRLENCVLWWYMCPVTCYQEVVFSSNKTLAKCCKPSAASRVLHAECCKPSAACHVLHAKCCMSRAAPQAVEKTCRCDHNLCKFVVDPNTQQGRISCLCSQIWYHFTVLWLNYLCHIMNRMCIQRFTAFSSNKTHPESRVLRS